MGLGNGKSLVCCCEISRNSERIGELRPSSRAVIFNPSRPSFLAGFEILCHDDCQSCSMNELPRVSKPLSGGRKNQIVTQLHAPISLVVADQQLLAVRWMRAQLGQQFTRGMMSGEDRDHPFCTFESPIVISSKEWDDVPLFPPRPEAIEVPAARTAAGEEMAHHSSSLFGGRGSRDEAMKNFRWD